MRVIIAGSRTLCDPQTTFAAIKAAQAAGFEIDEVVCGMAPGPDLLGKRWADEQVPPVPVTKFPANWQKHGNKAGNYRNVDMGVYAATGPKGGGLILTWDGKSTGSAHMLKVSKNFKLKIFVFKV